jgi:hypothetical protein
MISARRAIVGGAVAVALAALLPEAGGSASTAERAQSPDVPFRGCARRVESQGIIPDAQRDTVIGPVALYRVPTLYEGQATRPDVDSFDALPVKALVLVRAGKRVTLVVPPRQRTWMRLHYRLRDQPRRTYAQRGRKAVTLHACRKLSSRRAQRKECRWRPYTACGWRNTQFNGSVNVDFAEAPRGGLCAELIVTVEGRRKSLRERLVRPAPKGCR